MERPCSRFRAPSWPPTGNRQTRRCRCGAFEQPIPDQSLYLCLQAAKYPLFGLGSQFKSLLFNASLLNTPFATPRPRCGRRLRITHLCSNFLVLGRRVPPESPQSGSAGAPVEIAGRTPAISEGYRTLQQSELAATRVLNARDRHPVPGVILDPP